MKYTNHANLPQPIVDAVIGDTYSKGDADISVTELDKPARQRELQRRYREHITEDISDSIYRLMGQAVHTILERAEKQAIAERRVFTERHGWRISGAMDRVVILDGNSHPGIQDYKTTSIYAVKDGCTPPWARQLNTYRLMVRERGILISWLQVVAILRDWSKVQARIKNDYPISQVTTIDVPVWSDEATEDYIKQRLIAHGRARDELPECSEEERWAKPTLFKVKKKGGQRAVNGGVFPDSESAEKFAKEKGDDYEVTVTEGECTRCQHYCNVAEFCDQWAAIKPRKLVA